MPSIVCLPASHRLLYSFAKASKLPLKVPQHTCVHALNMRPGIAVEQGVVSAVGGC